MKTVLRFFREPLAQPVEHIPFKDGVDGSNPSRLTISTAFLSKGPHRLVA